MRFKIDINPYGGSYMFSLKVKQGWSSWVTLDTFRTRGEARAYYEKIKDLPKYLP